MVEYHRLKTIEEGESESVIQEEPIESLSSTIAKTSIFEWLLAIGFIMGGCCSNAYFLELLVKDAPSSGQLITLCQFLLMSIEGFFTNLTFPEGSSFPALKERNVPLSRWFTIVLLFFSSSLLNNVAFNFKIPMVLHIVFRSAGLFANMFLGWILLKKSYNIKQIVSITIVTVGVIITTLNTVQHKSDSAEDTTFFTQLIGVLILTIALFLSAGLGLLQEVTYKKYGKHWKEALFYTHFLALPLFLPFAGEIAKSTVDYFSSDPLSLRGLASDLLNAFGISNMPKLILFLIGNVITQYFCVSGVQRLSSISSALVLNLVLTLRKMVSILISVVYLGTAVNSMFVLGAIMAFAGALAFSLAKSNNAKPDDKRTT